MPSTTFLLYLLLLLGVVVCNTSYKLTDPYGTLGLNKSATADQIRASYKKLAIKYHPDRNKNDPNAAKEKFILISKAYEILKDDEKKRQFDLYGIHDDAPEGHEQESHSDDNEEEFVFWFENIDPFETFNDVFQQDDESGETMTFSFTDNVFGERFVRSAFNFFEEDFADDDTEEQIIFREPTSEPKPKKKRKLTRLPILPIKDFNILFLQNQNMHKEKFKHHPQQNHVHVVLLYKEYLPSDKKFKNKIQKQILKLVKKELKEEYTFNLVHLNVLPVSSESKFNNLISDLEAIIPNFNKSSPLLFGRSHNLETLQWNPETNLFDFIQKLLLIESPMQPKLRVISDKSHFLRIMSEEDTYHRSKIVIFSRHDKTIPFENVLINKFHLLIDFSFVHVDSEHHWTVSQGLINYDSVPCLIINHDNEHMKVIPLLNKHDLYEHVVGNAYQSLPVLYTESMVWDYCSDHLCILYVNDKMYGSQYDRHCSVMKSIDRWQKDRYSDDDRVRFAIINDYEGFSKMFKRLTRHSFLVSLHIKDKQYRVYKGLIKNTNVIRWMSKLMDDELPFNNFEMYDKARNRYLSCDLLHPIQVGGLQPVVPHILGYITILIIVITVALFLIINLRSRKSTKTHEKQE
ncbi:DnaJ [Acrasis kona]|uniref:DnaJ n=1 Tax=Acrasis kona TaxID=1008807 RepID=A0AAW2YMJ5_9EUKA